MGENTVLSVTTHLGRWIARHPFLASTSTYAAVTAVMGRHVLGSLGTRIASDPGDPLLNAAILAWNAVGVPWTDAWYRFPIFYPTADALALSEHLLGVSVVASPVYWLTGNPLIAYNLTLLLSYPLSGAAMYLLVRRLARSAPAAFLAGLAFAFAPYRAGQLPHLQMLITWWAPLALLGLHAFVEGRLNAAPAQAVAEPAPSRCRVQAALALALFAACWLLQGAANTYFLVYLTVVVGLWTLWFTIARARLHATAAIAAAAAVSFLPLAPVIHRYLQTHRDLGLSRNLGEIASFSADIAAPLCAPASLTFWGWLRVACAPEGDLFIGAGLVALCLAGAFSARENEPQLHGGARTSRDHTAPRGDPARRARNIVSRVSLAIAAGYILIAVSVALLGPWRIGLGWFRASASSADKPISIALALLLVVLLLSRWLRKLIQRGSTATFYFATAVICWVLSWGPLPRLFGAEALYQAPFAWLMLLPGVDGLRVPARFWMMTVLCLAVFMGTMMGRLLSGRTARARVIIVALGACALLTDGWMTIPTAPVPQAPTPAASLAGAVVLELPAGQLLPDISALYRAVTGGWRTVNGFSGYEPGYYEALRTLSAANDDALLAPFVMRADLHVVVPETDANARALLERQPGVERLQHVQGRLYYRIPRPGHSADPAPADGREPRGQRLPVRSLEASCSPEGAMLALDDDIATHWVCGDQRSEHQLAAELTEPRRVGALVHALGTRGADFPRYLVVETSTDGSTWEPAWEGSPAAEVLVAAMDAPRLTRVVIGFPPRTARYVRLRQTGRHDVHYWSIAELQIWTAE